MSIVIYMMHPKYRQDLFYFVPRGYTHFLCYPSFSVPCHPVSPIAVIRSHSVCVSGYMIIWWYVNNIHQGHSTGIVSLACAITMCSGSILPSFRAYCYLVLALSLGLSSDALLSLSPFLLYQSLPEHSPNGLSIPRSHVIPIRRIVRPVHWFLHSVPTILNIR